MNEQERFIAQYLEQKAITQFTLPSGEVRTTYACKVIDNHGIQRNVKEHITTSYSTTPEGFIVSGPERRQIDWH